MFSRANRHGAAPLAMAAALNALLVTLALAAVEEALARAVRAAFVALFVARRLNTVAIGAVVVRAVALTRPAARLTRVTCTCADVASGAG